MTFGPRIALTEGKNRRRGAQCQLAGDRVVGGVKVARRGEAESDVVVLRGPDCGSCRLRFKGRGKVEKLDQTR